MHFNEASYWNIQDFFIAQIQVVVSYYLQLVHPKLLVQNVFILLIIGNYVIA
jgi:hypothetical protein